MDEVDDDPTFFNNFVDSISALAFMQAGVHPCWYHAYLETKLTPLNDGTFHTEADRRAWQGAVDSFRQVHPEMDAPDLPGDFARWRAHQAMAPFQTLAHNPAGAALVLDWLRDPQDNHRDRGLVLFLTETRDDLFAAVDAGAALRLAEHWGGPPMVTEVQNCLDTGPAADPSAHLVALAVMTVAHRLPDRVPAA